MILYLCFIILCKTDDTPKGEKDINSFDTAIEIMTVRKSAGKSLCLDEHSPTQDDIMQIKVEFAKIMGKQTNDQIVDNAVRVFLDDYSITRSDSEDINLFTHEYFLEKDCQTRHINKNDVAQQLIDEFSLKKSNIPQLKSAQVLAYSCEIERLYNIQLNYARSDTKGKERRIVEMSYFVYRTKNDILGRIDDMIGFNLTFNTEELIRKTSNVNMSPDKRIVNCLLRNAETLYELGELEYIVNIFKMLIDNLGESETCYLGTLSLERQSYLSGLFAETVHGKFDEVERKAIFASFELLLKNYDYINIFGRFGLYEYLETFMNFSQCTFDNNRFSSDFLIQRQNIHNYRFGKIKLENIGQVVAVYCLLSDLKITPQVALSNDYKNNITRIMDLYTFFLNGLKGDTEEKFTTFLYKHMKTVRGNSRKTDRSFSQSYYNKLQYACMLKNGQVSFKNRFQPLLGALENFMNTVYAPLHCHNRIWNKEDFDRGMMDRLLGVIDYDLISLDFIYECIVGFLDQSSELKDVNWTKFIHFDGQSCSVQKNINYQTLKFDQNSTIINDYNSFKESVIFTCSSIYSIARAVRDSQQTLSLQDKTLICSTYIHLFGTVTQFGSLPVGDKVIAIKNYIGINVLISKQEIGRKGILECEILRVATIGSHYESPLFMSLYSLVAATYFDNKSCSYIPDTFNDGNLEDLSSVLMKHSELKNYSVNDIKNHIIPNLKIICNEYNSLLSKYKLSPEFTIRLINERTCILDEFYDVNLPNEMHNFLVETDKYNFPDLFPSVVKVMSCYALREIKSTMSELEDKTKLSSSDLTILDELLSKVMNENPNLKEKTATNFRYLFINVSKTERFNLLINSSLKVSLAECNLRQSYFTNGSSSSDSGGSGDNSGAGNSSVTVNNNGTIDNSGSGDNNSTRDSGASGNNGTRDNNVTSDVNDAKNDENKLSFGVIAGLVIGAISGVCILGGGAIYYVRLSKKSH